MYLDQINSKLSKYKKARGLGRNVLVTKGADESKLPNALAQIWNKFP